jgi:photosystem II stability/assembly factor-like uncharacterized protein
MIISCEQQDSPVFVPFPKTSGWNPVILNISENLNDIYFVSESTGWIAGENQLLLSTASGNVGWSLAPVEFPLENLRGVFFIDDQLGWVAGDLSDENNKGQVGYSGLGGGYPVQLETFENPITSLFFTDSKTGWITGKGGLLAKTEDGGFKWQMIPLFTENTLYDIYFPGDLSGWAVGGKGEIFHTVNGISWDREDSGVESDILAVHFVDESYGWACGSNNTILIYQAEEESPGSWVRNTIENEFSTMEWSDIFFVSRSTGWIIGESGNVYKSTDGGNIWDKEESNVKTDLKAIHMVNSGKGWIVGENGVIISYGTE